MQPKNILIKKLTSKLQRTANVVFFYYPYLFIANLFNKQIPTCVAENYYTMKNSTLKL